MRNPLPSETKICLIDPRGRGGALLTLFNILKISASRHSLSIEPIIYVEILKNPSVFDRGKGELENAKGREHESIFTFKMAFLECFQTDVLPQAQQSVTLLTRERYRIVKISSRHHTYSFKVEKPSELACTFQVHFGILFPST